MTLGLADRTPPSDRTDGFVVNPYQTATATNRFRWQVGIVAPRTPSTDGPEPSFTETVCLLEASEHAHLTVRLRFLQIEERTTEEIDPAHGHARRVPRLEVDGRALTTWEQGLLHTRTAGVPLRAGQPATVLPVEVSGGLAVEHIADSQGFVRARWVRRCQPLDGQMRVHVESVEDYFRVTVRFENLIPWQPEFGANRAALLSHSFVSTHLVLAADRARFVSLLEPPATAAVAAASCHSTHVHPVLVGNSGRQDLMLSAPIQLRDYPPIGVLGHDPSAVGEFDEMVSLRLMTMTDADGRTAIAQTPS